MILFIKALIVFWGCCEAFTSVQNSQINSDQESHFIWRRRNSLPMPMADFAVAHDDDEESPLAYIMGGCINMVRDVSGLFDNCLNTTNNVWLYDAQSDSYTSLPPFTTPRFRHAAVFANNLIYLFGGRGTDDGIIPTMQIFNTATRTWAPETTSNGVLASDVVSFAYMNNVYYSGGYNANYDILSDAYKLVNNQWQKIASMKTARGDAFAEQVGNRIYIVGGFGYPDLSPLDTVEVFDGNTFVLHNATLAPGRGDGAVCAIGSKLFVFGGESPSGTPRDEVEVLTQLNQVQGNDFRFAGELPSIRFRLHCASLLPGSVHVFGGQTLNTELLSRVDQFQEVRIVDNLVETLSTPLRLSGTANAMKWMATVGSVLESRARAPVRITYQAMDSLRAQTLFVGNDDTNFYPMDDVYVMDLPLTSQVFGQLKALGHSVLQLPLSMSPVGFYLFGANSTANMSLSACDLAKIYNGKKKYFWSEFNATQSLHQVAVHPIRQTLESSMTITLKKYLSTECPSLYDEAGFDLVPVSDTKAPPQLKVGELAYAYFSHLVPTTVYMDVPLENKFGFSQQVKDAELVAVDNLPTSFADDLSSFEFVRQDLRRSWPVVSVTFAVVRADQALNGQTGALLLHFLSTVLMDSTPASSFQHFAFPAPWRNAGLVSLRTQMRVAWDSVAYTDVKSGDLSENPFSFASAQQTRFDIESKLMASQLAVLKEQVQTLSSSNSNTDDEDDDGINDVLTYNIAVSALVFAVLGFLLASVALIKVRRVQKQLANLSLAPNQAGAGGGLGTPRSSFQNDHVQVV